MLTRGNAELRRINMAGTQLVQRQGLGGGGSGHSFGWAENRIPLRGIGETASGSRARLVPQGDELPILPFSGHIESSVPRTCIHSA